MNGTIFDKIKQNVDIKKKEKLKFIVAIFSTNLLIAFLCLSFGAPSSNPKEAPRYKEKIVHPHFKMVILPLKLLADIKVNATESPVTLMNKAKKIIIYKAYLHEEQHTSQNETISSLSAMTKYKIEIPEDQVLKLSSEDNESIMAIPEIEMPTTTKTLTIKRVSQYEINL